MAQGVAGLENIMRQARGEPEPPDDFDDKEDFLEWVRKTFQDDLQADKENREEGVKDLEFFAGEQWDDAVKQKRGDKPVLTLNRLPAFVQQLVGNRRLNETHIKIIPDSGGTKDVAQIREGLVRNIQKVSRADRAYDKAYENQVICGIGNFQLALTAAHDDVFDQDITIEGIPNPFSVVWDRMAVDPTGEDARHVFVVDTLDKTSFEEMYPESRPSEMTNDTNLLGSLKAEGWVTDSTVRVVSVWRLRSEPAVVAMLTDGDVVEVKSEEHFLEISEQIQTQADGSLMVRETERRFAEMHLVTGHDILEGPYRLQIQRVPVFRANGWEVNVGDKRTRFGLVRFLRDPQRLHNYWRSVIAERLMLSPKAPWTGPASAFEGYEEEWRNAHRNDAGYIPWNDEAPQAPQRTEPAQMEQALINEAGMASQDIRDITNLHEASMGQQSNEVSGRAITARQRVGELGSVIYQDNLNEAQGEAGKVINQLIPTVYDTARIIKVLKPESESIDSITINDPENPESIDITIGKYDVTTVTGPSYVTKRVEAADSMLNLINAMPETMAVAADKIVEAQDWPGAEEIARRLRLTLPPGMLSEEDMSPEQKQQQQQQAQAQAQQQQVQMAQTQADLQEKQARATEAMARARQSAASAIKSLREIDIQEDETMAEIRSQQIQDTLEALRTLDQISGNSDESEQ